MNETQPLENPAAQGTAEALTNASFQAPAKPAWKIAAYTVLEVLGIVAVGAGAYYLGKKAGQSSTDQASAPQAITE